VLEQQAESRAATSPPPSPAIVTQYLKERRREVVALASLPQLATVVRQADQTPYRARLDRMPIPDLERMFNATSPVGGRS